MKMFLSRRNIWARIYCLIAFTFLTLLAAENGRAQIAAGRAFDFDGTDDYVRVVPATTLAGDYTVEAWLRPQEATKIMSYFGTRGGFDFGLDIKFRDGNTIIADIGTGSTWLTTSASAPLNYTVGTWYHVALVVTSTGYTYYINGVMASTGAYAAGTPMIYNPQRPILLGNYGYLNQEFWKGSIDEVRVWSVARSAAQIKEAYNLRADGSEAGLEILWHLDEFESRHVLDSTGHGFEATTFFGVSFVNSTAPILPAVASRALAFNGVNQYVSVPEFGTVIPTNEVTVEFWAFTAAQRGQSAFMLNPDENTNRFQAHLNYSNGQTYWDFGNININGRLNVTSPQNTVGNWVHYAMVASQEGNFMRIYVNGQIYMTFVDMSPFVRGTYELRIGGSTGFFYGGKLDEFRVWNKARSQVEIQGDYQKTLTGSETNLVVYYDFDSETGTVLTNRAAVTGATLNGTLMNSPAWVNSTAPIVYAPEVTSSADHGKGSLRYALLYSAAGRTITLPASLSGQTTVLQAGPLLVDRNLTIDGSGTFAGLRLEGYQFRWPVMRVLPGITATMNALTFAKGGGTNDGAGIHNLGTLTLNRCTISENVAFFHGSGIFNGSGATLNVNQCTISGNLGFGGGGMFNQGTVSVDQSTIVGNTDDFGGGGVENQGTFSVKNSIIGGNLPKDVLNKTAFNSVAVNIVSNLLNDGGTISGTALRTGNPLLGPLADNGGPTKTHALGNGSPARNASVGSGFPTDQRGAAFDGVRDLGSYETGSAANYETWVFESFPSGTSGQLTAGAADYDLDGRNNAEEYARVTDPAVPDAPPTLTLTVNAAITVTTNVFRLRPSNKDITYSLDYNTGLALGGWFNVLRIDNINGSHNKDSLVSTNIVNGVITVIDTYDGVNTAFYRLRTEYKPPVQ